MKTSSTFLALGGAVLSMASSIKAEYEMMMMPGDIAEYAITSVFNLNYMMCNMDKMQSDPRPQMGEGDYAACTAEYQDGYKQFSTLVNCTMGEVVANITYDEEQQDFRVLKHAEEEGLLFGINTTMLEPYSDELVGALGQFYLLPQFVDDVLAMFGNDFVKDVATSLFEECLMDGQMSMTDLMNLLLNGIMMETGEEEPIDFSGLSPLFEKGSDLTKEEVGIIREQLLTVVIGATEGGYRRFLSVVNKLPSLQKVGRSLANMKRMLQQMGQGGESGDGELIVNIIAGGLGLADELGIEEDNPILKMITSSSCVNNFRTNISAYAALLGMLEPVQNEYASPNTRMLQDGGGMCICDMLTASGNATMEAVDEVMMEVFFLNHANGNIEKFGNAVKDMLIHVRDVAPVNTQDKLCEAVPAALAGSIDQPNLIEGMISEECLPIIAVENPAMMPMLMDFIFGGVKSGCNDMTQFVCGPNMPIFPIMQKERYTKGNELQTAGKWFAYEVIENPLNIIGDPITKFAEAMAVACANEPITDPNKDNKDPEGTGSVITLSTVTLFISAVFSFRTFFM